MLTGELNDKAAQLQMTNISTMVTAQKWHSLWSWAHLPSLDYCMMRGEVSGQSDIGFSLLWEVIRLYSPCLCQPQLNWVCAWKSHIHSLLLTRF